MLRTPSRRHHMGTPAAGLQLALPRDVFHHWLQSRDVCLLPRP
jgi:hypothetical protein